MHSSSIYVVGQPSEVRHHVSPLEQRLPLRIVSADQVACRARPGDLAIFLSEHFDRFRSACRSLKDQNVATLYVIDGILEWRNAWENRTDEPACPYAMRPVLSHKVACIGPSQARVLDSWGNSEKTEIVGIPRLDGLSKTKRKSTSHDKFRILVMTAKTPGFTENQIQKVKQGLHDLQTWFRHSSNIPIDGRPIEVVWRLTSALDQELGVVNQLNSLTGSELASQLQEVDAVITTPSTAILEAMILKLPVAVLDYHNCPAYVPTAWSIRSADQIGSIVRELVASPESKMIFQNMQLREALFRQTGATDRLERLVTEMLRIANDQVMSHQPIKFPNQILDPILHPAVGVTAEFDHRQVYPHTEEFSRRDLVELQVELSHARREIQHLQREQEQLQRELQQAHEIFDEIHRHPVAGPVVRIRQKWLGWLAKLKAPRQCDPQLASSPSTSSRGER